MKLGEILSHNDYSNKYITTSGSVFEKNSFTELLVRTSKVLGLKIFDRVAVATELKKSLLVDSRLTSLREKVSSLSNRLLGNKDESGSLVEENTRIVSRIFCSIVSGRASY